MLSFVSSEYVYVGLRLVPLAILGTDVMPLSEVWNSTCWKFDGFAGGGAYGDLIFAMLDVGRVYMLQVKICIGVDMGG